MTALSEYQRLEASALWRDAPDGQRREVMVSLGDATLMITAMSDVPLSHWSLPAVERLNPGLHPALYAPDEHAHETLEITDTEMISAIEKLRGAIERARPHPGRLRVWLIALAICTVAALSVLWLPGALTRQTAAILPEAKRVQLGQDLLAEMAMLAGSPCNDETGLQALRQLSVRVLGADAPRLVILPQVISGTAHLPGNIMILDRGLVEDHETPEVLAGHVLAEGLRQAAGDPTLRLLTDAGLGPTLQLLTTGDLHPRAVHSHATWLLTEPAPDVETDTFLAAFDAAQISSEPYAYALDISGETTLPLIEGNPMRGRATGPLINDQSWIALQGICGG